MSARSSAVALAIQENQLRGISESGIRSTVTAGVSEESKRNDASRNANRRSVQERAVDPRTAKAGFPRSARLLRHADFERVYKQGRRHFSTSMTVFYRQRVDSDQDAAKQTAGKFTSPVGMRVGFTVGRVLGGATERNRMKRRLREAVRLTRPFPGAGVDVVINPKKSLLAVDFEALLNEVRRAFVVIEKNSSEYRVPSGDRQNEGSGRKPEA